MRSIEYILDAKRKVYRKYKWSAKKKNVDFSLDFDDFLSLTQSDCFYCKSPSEQESKTNNGDFHYNGIDRVDNNQGYVFENCVPCCTKCSVAKASMTSSDFMDLIRRIFCNSYIAKDDKKRCVFVGRFQPFHLGHETIIRKKLAENPVLILVRNTPIDSSNPYDLNTTISMIEAAFHDEDVVVLPITDIEGIYYGRGVGYNVEELIVTEDIKRISATDIRDRMKSNDNSWKDFVNPRVAEWLENYYYEHSADEEQDCS